MTSTTLFKKIQTLVADFNDNAEKAFAGNKSAAARSRKISVEIEKLLKEYRKVSIAEGKAW